MDHGFQWYQIVPFADKIPIHVFHALLILLLLLVFGWRIRRSINASADPMVPDTSFSARNIFEIVIDAVKGQLNSIIGRHSYFCRWKSRYFDRIGFCMDI